MEKDAVPLIKDGFTFNSKFVAFIGALLPGIACYLCIGYTYLFQSHMAANFTSEECPTIRR